MTRVIAVLDMGKTNAKMLFFTEKGDILAAHRLAQPMAVENDLSIHDVDAVYRWCEEVMAEVMAAHNVTGIMVSAHGCAFALMAGDRLAAPILDYEQEIPAEMGQAFDRLVPEFHETYSPPLPAGQNFSRHIFFQQQSHPAMFAKVSQILTYPQYWNWRLSGGMASEISYLGAHSHLWNPIKGDFSRLAYERGWAQKFPPLQPAGAIIGHYRGIAVHNGVHDSNAALYYFHAAGLRDFTLISTGTWVIIFNPACPLDRLDPARDMLANVTVNRQPVPTLRFMGGREFDLITQGQPVAVSPASLAAVIARGQMALPSFAAGGIFQGQTGRLVGPPPLNAEELSAMAALYLAMMMDVSLELLQSQGDLIIDGGLAQNDALLGILAALRPGQKLYRHHMTEGTAMGAAALAFAAQGLPQIFTPVLNAITAWSVPGLADYVAAWRGQALERASLPAVMPVERASRVG